MVTVCSYSQKYENLCLDIIICMCTCLFVHFLSSIYNSSIIHDFGQRSWEVCIY